VKFPLNSEQQKLLKLVNFLPSYSKYKKGVFRHSVDSYDLWFHVENEVILILPNLSVDLVSIYKVTSCEGSMCLAYHILH